MKPTFKSWTEYSDNFISNYIELFDRTISTKPLTVAELFAGVGGFRLGLEAEPSEFQVVWSNQWEPSTKKQHASEVYERCFGKEGHTNKDITLISTDEIPNVDVLVGGFPCQDYSVAKSLPMSKGIYGKKGVLWWQIERILRQKVESNNPIKYLILENVDRLIKSPSTQRGRDFAVMLASLSDLGYFIEWRVINAADYGFTQRRRRLFIVARYQESLTNDSLLNTVFPIESNQTVFKNSFELVGNLESITENFNSDSSNQNKFESFGYCHSRNVVTYNVEPAKSTQKLITLESVLEPTAPDEYYISLDELPKWQYQKGAKREKRIASSGFEYDYTEGSMVFPDALDKPSRTIITAEGGKSPSRFKHVIQCPSGKGLRRLTPIELERLNTFPDNHTKFSITGEKISDTKRAFFMGNALVVGVVSLIARDLWKYHNGVWGRITND